MSPAYYKFSDDSDKLAIMQARLSTGWNQGIVVSVH